MYAAIDLGTNSVRLLIMEKKKDRLHRIYQDLVITRLGKGMTVHQCLSEKAMEDTLIALKDFVTAMKDYKVAAYSIVATSAVREAKNAHVLIQKVKEALELDIRTISGEEEAYLSYIGACHGMGHTNGIAVVDIGGGSTEVVYKKNGRLQLHSAPIGAVRLLESGYSPTKIFAVLKDTLKTVKSVGDLRAYIAVGGTATTLGAMISKMESYDPERIQGMKVDVQEVSEQICRLSALSKEQRRQVVGLQPERADIIIPGLMILWVMMTHLNLDSILLSDADLLYGLITTLDKTNPNYEKLEKR